MHERTSKARDINEIAFDVLAATVGEENTEKNPAAVALGRLGGKKGGPARARKLSKKRRRSIAIKAAKVRWSKKKSTR